SAFAPMLRSENKYATGPNAKVLDTSDSGVGTEVGARAIHQQGQRGRTSSNILALRNQPILERYAASNLLVGFDFDGTLAPIVAAPERAHMRPVTRRLLKAVAARYPCVVISGRSRDDLVYRLRDIPIVHISGNHGLEPWAEEPRYIRQTERWVQQLSPRLAPFSGVMIENKTYSISIHYRAARDKMQALRAIDRATRDLRGARRLGGRLVVNVLPKGAPTKGTALERARRLLVC